MIIRVFINVRICAFDCLLLFAVLQSTKPFTSFSFCLTIVFACLISKMNFRFTI
jgi:hypothetical protein